MRATNLQRSGRTSTNAGALIPEVRLRLRWKRLGRMRGLSAVTELPEDDCDCNGNQRRCDGECGGADAPTTPRATTMVPGNGICDDVDDCVGDYDECGICNGPGDIYECGCSRPRGTTIHLQQGDCDVRWKRLAPTNFSNCLLVGSVAVTESLIKRRSCDCDCDGQKQCLARTISDSVNAEFCCDVLSPTMMLNGWHLRRRRRLRG